MTFDAADPHEIGKSGGNHRELRIEQLHIS